MTLTPARRRVLILFMSESSRRTKVLDALSREVAKAEDVSARVKATNDTAELIRLSKALEQITTNICRTVEAELKLRRSARAVERRARARLAAMSPPSRAIH